MTAGSPSIAFRLRSAATDVLRGEVVGYSIRLNPDRAMRGLRAGRVPAPRRLLPVGVLWFMPRPRGILHPNRVHIQKNVRRRMRNNGWESSLDESFDAVLAGCANRQRTWLGESLQALYRALHERGVAHSVEIWDDDGALIGGLFGVRCGGVFQVISMFHANGDESKVALADCAERMDAAGAAVIDLHWFTPHLGSMGAEQLPAPAFLDLLAARRDDDITLDPRRRPVTEILTWAEGHPG
ncbi:MAG: leucyl/phenylalanyl-tRNA--protein transferase [Actinomycetota bacterium]